MAAPNLGGTLKACRRMNLEPATHARLKKAGTPGCFPLPPKRTPKVGACLRNPQETRFPPCSTHGTAQPFTCTHTHTGGYDHRSTCPNEWLVKGRIGARVPIIYCMFRSCAIHAQNRKYGFASEGATSASFSMASRMGCLREFHCWALNSAPSPLIRRSLAGKPVIMVLSTQASLLL